MQKYLYNRDPRKRRLKGVENLFEEIIAENLPQPEEGNRRLSPGSAERP